MININNHYIQTDVTDIIAELKTQLKLNGVELFYKTTDTPKNTMVCCPFHKQGQEKKPSMGILKTDGTCHCFTCGWVGSLQELISNCFGYDDWGVFGEKWLVRNFLSLDVSERKDLDLDMSRSARHICSTQFVGEDELDSYRFNHPYWSKRHITDPYIIELFDLGYDANTDCITFPVRDIRGRCVFVARRSVVGKFFNYPNGAEKPLYGLYELWNLPKLPYEVYVTESMIDCLTIWQYGKYAVAMNGTGNQLQMKQLRALPCRKIILATDNDDAGMRARKIIAKELPLKLVTQVMLPDGKKDINELTKDEFLMLEENLI